MNSYMEAMIINVAKHQGADYGRQRVFADIGICFTSFITGVACEHFNVDDNISPFSPALFIFPACALLMIPIGCVLVDQAKIEVVDDWKDEDQKNNNNFDDSNDANMDDRSLAAKALQLCSQLDVFLFLLTSFIAGLLIAIYFNFSFKYLTEKSNRSKSENSLVIVISSLGSILVFPFTTRIIKFFGSNMLAINFGLLCGCLRFFIMYLNVSFEVFVSAQLLNGFSFALLFTAMMEEIFVISPKEINMTMNNIVMVLFFFISSLVGNIGGSAVYSQFGGATLFLGTSLTAGVWALFMTAHHVYKRKRMTLSDDIVLHNFNNIDKLTEATA